MHHRGASVRCVFERVINLLVAILIVQPSEICPEHVERVVY